MENRIAVLRGHADRLWSRRERLTQAERQALIEASFRMGVHPRTPAAEALALLWRAHRLDPGNPKHPYHLGLVYLRHGRFEQASVWLTAAARLSPTSHRIWAHLGIVQRCLDEEHVGRPGYTDAFRRRAEAISQAIRAGEDRLDPDGPPGAPRILGAGRCRWSGVHDVEVENRLRGAAGERTRNAVYEELQHIAGLAARRHGGAAAFAVPAVQWLLQGYPVASLRRLDGAPWPRLLRDVCALFEVDEAELPGRLAAHLEHGTLPGLLIAMIHHRRLLWRPLSFPDPGVHTAARGFVRTAAGPDENARAAEYSAALMTAVRRLTAPPPRAMRDVAGPAGERGAVEWLTSLEDATRTLAALRRQAIAMAKKLNGEPVTDLAAFARLSGDRETVDEAAGLIATAVAARLKEWKALGAADRSAPAVPAEDFLARYAACETGLQDLTGKGAVSNHLKRLGRKLAKVAADFPDARPSPTAQAVGLREAARRAAPAADGDEPPVPPPPEPTGTGRARVVSALELADTAMDESIERAWRTFDAYPPAARRQGALGLLCRYVAGHQAETLYRTGRAVEARRVWNRMLADDPLDVAVLRNLAVAHTAAGDVTAATTAWTGYLEALYTIDLIGGDPGPGALRRAEAHRVLAGSFGTAPLGRSSDREDDEDLSGIPAVLASVTRVSVFVSHLRLELLNRALAQRATLVLGIGPECSGDDLAAARDRAVAGARTACEALPPRISAAFGELCEATMTKAYEEATSPGAAVPDEAQKQAYTDTVKALFLRKIRIRNGLLDEAAGWAASASSGDVIANLRLIDAVALNPADELTRRTVQRLDPGSDPAEAIERADGLADLACRAGIQQIFEEAKETEDPSFPVRFRRAGESWVRNEVTEEYLEQLDDPRRVYEPSAEAAVRALGQPGDELDQAARETVDAAVPELERWIGVFSGASGPARLLARLLAGLHRYDRAHEVLSQARDAVFSPVGGRRIGMAVVDVDLSREEFPIAVMRVRRLLERGPDGAAELRRLLAYAYDRWIRTAPGGPDPKDIERDFAAWDDEESVEDRRRLVVSATIATHNAAARARPGGAGMSMLVRRFKLILADDEGNRHARYNLVLAQRNRVMELRAEERATVGPRRREVYQARKYVIAECVENCTAYLAGAGTDERRQRAEVERILAELSRT